MIEIWRLERRLSSKKEAQNAKYRHIVSFYEGLGHGTGRVDFTQKIASFSEEQWSEFLFGASEWASFKLGNVIRFGEVEILASDAAKLASQMPHNSPLKEILSSLEEGYIIARLAS